MRYTVCVRLKNPGPAKYLMESQDADDFMDAFYGAKRAAEKADKDCFVEIVDNNSGETIATFNGGDGHEEGNFVAGTVHRLHGR